MSCPPALSQWETIVSTHLPHLSRPQARVLAAWSYGMVLAKWGGITSVVAMLAPLFQRWGPTVRRRLREWFFPFKTNKGPLRQGLGRRVGFPPWLAWA